MIQEVSIQSGPEPKDQLFARPTGPNDVYRNTALDMLANNMLQQIRNIEQVQIIKGEAGLGKSCFCQRLMQQAEQNISITLITATRKTDVTEILRHLGNRSEADHSAPLQVLAKIAAQKIYQQLYNGLQTVVLIDDAHNLSTQTLANLFRFQHAIAQQNSGGFKLILVGERKLDSHLEKVDKKIIGRDRFLSNLLRPLNRSEIDDYLNFKFACAQIGKLPFTAKQLAHIRSNCGGIPGKIEMLALRTLNGDTSSPKHRLLAISLAGILCAGLAVYAYYDSTRDDARPRRTATVRDIPAPASPGSEDAGTTDSAYTSNAEDTQAQPVSGLEWLSNLPAEHYLIQLLGSRDQAKLEQYRQSLQLTHPLTLHATVRNDEDWYLLFYGPFSDYESAVEARALLPEDLRQNQPWIRQIGSILEKP